MRLLGLDEVWWLVSPQNPLKPVASMASLAARLRSAEVAARHPRIRAMTIEVALRTRFTVDTVAALKRRRPDTAFIWLMGADILAELHRWHRWRAFARQVPIAVFARPGYIDAGLVSPAMAWLKRWRHPPAQALHWTEWPLPGIVFLEIRRMPVSASAIRRADPDWPRHLEPTMRHRI